MGAPRLDKFSKNYIINGNFDFWLRATGSSYSGTGTASGYAWADRFMFQASTTNNRANRAVNRSTDVPSFAQSGFNSTYSLQYTQTAALALAASDYLIFLEQMVEGIFYRDLHGKDITLSFWFKSTVAGQYPAAFRNNGATRSYVTLFNYDVANVWQKIFITVPTDVSGSGWLFNNGRGLDIILCSSTGATFQTPTLDQWVNGNYSDHPSAVRIQAQTNITITVAQLRLVEGSLQQDGFSFAGRDYASEQTLCERYYEWVFFAAETSLASGSQTGLGGVNWRTEKRTVPIVDSLGNGNSNSLRNQNTGATVTGMNFGPGIYGSEIRFTSAQTDNVLYAGTVIADAEL